MEHIAYYWSNAIIKKKYAWNDWRLPAFVNKIFCKFLWISKRAEVIWFHSKLLIYQCHWWIYEPYCFTFASLRSSFRELLINLLMWKLFLYSCASKINNLHSMCVVQQVINNTMLGLEQTKCMYSNHNHCSRAAKITTKYIMSCSCSYYSSFSNNVNQ